MPTTYYADGITRATPLPAETPLGSKETGGVWQLAKDYTMTGDEVANDLVFLGNLPVGAEVQKVGSYVRTVGTAAATLTVDIGDTTTADRYATALDVAAAGVDAFDEDPLFTVTSATQGVYLKFKTLSTPGTGVLKVRINYRAN